MSAKKAPAKKVAAKKVAKKQEQSGESKTIILGKHNGKTVKLTNDTPTTFGNVVVVLPEGGKVEIHPLFLK